MSKDEEKKPKTISLSFEAWKALKVYCADNDKQMGAVVADLIMDNLR